MAGPEVVLKVPQILLTSAILTLDPLMGLLPETQDYYNAWEISVLHQWHELGSAVWGAMALDTASA